jgi:hypothetical protein
MLDAQGESVGAMLSRMTLNCVSWTRFRNEIAAVDLLLDNAETFFERE